MSESTASHRSVFTVLRVHPIAKHEPIRLGLTVRKRGVAGLFYRTFHARLIGLVALATPPAGVKKWMM